MGKIVISPLVTRPLVTRPLVTRPLATRPLATRLVGVEFELEGIRLRVELAPEDGSLSGFVCTSCVGCFMCDMDALCTDEPWYSGLGSCDSYHREDGQNVYFKKIGKVE